MPQILWFVVVDVHHSGAVKDVTARFERSWDFGWRAKIEQRGKGEKHSTPIVGDGGMALSATDPAGQAILGLTCAGVVKIQGVQTVYKSNVSFVKYHCPLKRGAV